jgi:hypothetical protein
MRYEPIGSAEKSVEKVAEDAGHHETDNDDNEGRCEVRKKLDESVPYRFHYYSLIEENGKGILLI